MIYPLVHGSWSAVGVSALWLTNVGLARICARSLFARAWFRRFLAVSVLGIATSHAMWALFGSESVLGRAGITMAAASPVFLVLSLLSIPFAGVFLAFAMRSPKSEPSRPEDSVDELDTLAEPPAVGAEFVPSLVLSLTAAPVISDKASTVVLEAPPALVSRPRLTRRGLLTGAAAIAPAVALGAGLQGFRRGFSKVAVRERTLVVPSLPSDLVGLRILQLSDVHLGVYRQLGDLEVALEEAARLRPDLVVLTGDFVEHGNLLPDALRLVRGVSPRLGTFACLGNHEYFQSVVDIRKTYEREGIPLLVDESATVATGTKTRLTVLGIDDPRWIRGDLRPTLRDSIEASLVRASGDFPLLLSHRPEAIFPASELDLGLVLSGHTHGGQIGFSGKSAFEPLSRDGYLWGPYTRARTGLYTTSGFGHWYPFRLGCESELPLLTLSSAA